jgi:hypothetical protein
MFWLSAIKASFPPACNAFPCACCCLTAAARLLHTAAGAGCLLLQLALYDNRLFMARPELARIGTDTGQETNSIYWARINPNNGTRDDINLLCTGTLASQAEGVIVSPSLHFAYPQVAVAGNGAMYITYAYSGAGLLPDLQSRQFPGGRSL